MATRRVHLVFKTHQEIRGIIYEHHVRPFVADATIKTINRARVLTPVDRGYLRASHTMSVGLKRGGTLAAGRIETPVKYAEAVHNGTQPHIIRAKQARALVFMWGKAGGRVVVPKRGAAGGRAFRTKDGTLIIGKGYVNHPGTKARPFYTQALREICEPLGFIVTTHQLGSESETGDTSALA